MLSCELNIIHNYVKVLCFMFMEYGGNTGIKYSDV